MAGEDGIDWLLQFDADVKGPKDALGILTELDKTLKAMNVNMAKMSGASNVAAAGHGKHGGEAKKLHGVLDRLRHAALDPLAHKIKEIAQFEFVRGITEGLMHLPGHLAHEIKELGAEILDVAAKTERTNRSFTLLFGDEGARHALEYIEQIAGHTEFTDDRLKSAAQELRKVGFGGEGMTRAIAASLDMAAFAPNPEEGFSSSLAALERIKRTGRIDNRVLGGLGLGEKDFLKEMESRTGMGAKTLKKKLDEGKIDTEESLEALFTIISKKTGKLLGGAGVEMSKTLGARLMHLKDIPDQIFQKLAGTEGMNKISSFVDELAHELSPEGQAGGRVVKGLKAVVDTIGDAIGEVDFKGLLESGLQVLDKMPVAVRTITETFKMMADVVGPVFKMMAFVADKITGPVKASELLKSKKEIIDDQVLGQLKTQLAIKRTLAARGEAFPEDAFFGPRESGIDRMKRMRKEAARGLAAGMSGSKGLVSAAGAELGMAAGEGASKALGIHSPSRLFADFGRMSAAGYVEGIEASIAEVDDAIGRMYPTEGIGSAGGAQGARISVQAIVNVHVGGGASAQSAEELGAQVASKVEEILPGHLQSALEQVLLQMGGSS